MGARRGRAAPKRIPATAAVKKGSYNPSTDGRLGRLVLLHDPEDANTSPNSPNWIHGVTTESEVSADGKEATGKYYVCLVGLLQHAQ
jgi:hypothetical protein